MTYDINPFAKSDTSGGDQDRYEIWEMLVRRDIHAFIHQDWSVCEGDFIAEHFQGIHAHNSPNPDSWTLAFPTLDAYRDEWLRQAHATAKISFAEDLAQGIFRATQMRDIEINGNRAVCHKKFDGKIAKADGTYDVLLWQTLYYAKKTDGVWKLTGFLGYLPHPLS